MPKTIELDFLSDDANVRRNTEKYFEKCFRQEQEKAAKRERMKRLVADLSKPKAMSATAGR